MSADHQITDKSTKRKHHKHRDRERSPRSTSRRKRPRDEQSSDAPLPHKKRRKTRAQEEPHDSKALVNGSKSDKSLAQSPFLTQTTSLYLPLSPVTQSAPLTGLCAEHLSPRILSYVPALKGILLSYSNPRLSNAPPSEALPVYGQSVNEYAVSYAWLTADFTVLRPERGVEMEGYVNVQNETRLGVLCWNLFNASIERRRLPRDWRWSGPTARRRRKEMRIDLEEEEEEDEHEHEDAVRREEEAEGNFVDGDGEVVKDRLVKFKMVDSDMDHSGKGTDPTGSTAGLVSFEGTMLDREEEQRLEREIIRLALAKKGKSRARS